MMSPIDIVVVAVGSTSKATIDADGLELARQRELADYETFRAWLIERGESTRLVDATLRALKKV